MIILRLFIAFLIGFAGHQTNPLFQRWEKGNAPAWPRLGRYSVGTLLLYLAMIVMSPRKHWEVLTHSFLSAAVGLGTGVAAGWVVDEVKW